MKIFVFIASFVIIINLCAMPASDYSINHVAMIQSGNMQNTHCIKAGCAASTSANDCMAQCIVSSAIIQPTQSLIIQIFVLAIIIAALVVLRTVTQRIIYFVQRIIPPPLYLFETVRLLE